MHELAVCQALLDHVQAVANAQAADQVTRVQIRIGPLSGVVPELLERAFYLARAGGPAACASLVMKTTGIRVRCRSCGRESAATPARLVCDVCGDYRTDLVEGDQLILERVELLRSSQMPEATSPGVQACVKPADVT
ncbi:MAG: hydrogenase maturation nickel metallochaperone HypA [Gammaproteobacteria bacterium]|nr:hydrogenase maturation nickel metallochaperone HypA [Gammaproteobacteria bacterium]MDE2345088.1 hydrogenase maturation nickel metallochaperone HypA [Gammaproteobacteria bacterium]